MLYAIVPIKQLGLVKSRFADTLLPAERRILALTMLEDVLQALVQSPAIDGIGVIGHDQEVFDLADRYCVDSIRDQAGNLNGALTQATQQYAARGAAAVLVLPADVPQVTPDEIALVVAAWQHTRQMVIVASHDGGTGALLLAPPLVIPFHFGRQSAARHRAAAEQRGVPVRQLIAAGLAHDLDSAADAGLLPFANRFTRTQHLLAGWKIHQQTVVDSRSQ
ncbi:MAG TPA: 2-phospho-L-lactate guanylyltransferase [Roseiflexaceae bacterium]|nr:2-phospho-L-lactate guanylyltransferase [Roseiflexaceae bacterium]